WKILAPIGRRDGRPWEGDRIGVTAEELPSVSKHAFVGSPSGRSELSEPGTTFGDDTPSQCRGNRRVPSMGQHGNRLDESCELQELAVLSGRIAQLGIRIASYSNLDPAMWMKALGFGLFLAVAPAAAFAQATIAGSVKEATRADRKQVLVLYSTRRDAQIVAVADRAIPRVLEDGLADGVDYYSDFIDRARFPSVDYQQAF